MFRVGQKVVCVVKDWAQRVPRSLPIEFPVEKEIYTIRDFSSRGYLALEEITNPPQQYTDGYGEAHFSPEAFRPLTDISIFQAIAAKYPVGETV